MDERMVAVNKVFERVEGIKQILIAHTNTVQVFLRLELIYPEGWKRLTEKYLLFKDESLIESSATASE